MIPFADILLCIGVLGYSFIGFGLYLLFGYPALLVVIGVLMVFLAGAGLNRNDSQSDS